MSENVDLVRSICAAWERGDFSSSDWASYDVDFTIADGSERGTWTGKAAMAEGARGWLSTWEDYRMDVEEYREVDAARVLVVGRFSGRGKTSGLEVTHEGAGLFDLHQGKVTRVVGYIDREHAFADLGLQG
jgi:ketosteroid isomerase-like protein